MERLLPSFLFLSLLSAVPGSSRAQFAWQQDDAGLTRSGEIEWAPAEFVS